MNHISIEHRRGDALSLCFPMVDSTDATALKTGLSPTDVAYYRSDAGVWTLLAITDTVTHVASGIYELNLTAAETAYEQITITATAAGAEAVSITVTLREFLSEDMAQSASVLRTAPAGDDNVVSDLPVAFVGNEDAGGSSSVSNEDGTYHEVSAAANALDLVYTFSLGTLIEAKHIKFSGYLIGPGDVLNIQAYNGSSWTTLAKLRGGTSTSNKHMTVGLNSVFNVSGFTYIRFVDDGAATAPSLFIDECVLGVVENEAYDGYVGGMIWVDSAGTSTAQVGVSGIASNPCDWATAKTMAASLSLNRFHVVSGDTVTLDAAADNFSFYGENYTLVQAGQTCVGLYVEGATVSGIALGTGTTQTYKNCILGSVSQIKGTHSVGCSIVGPVLVGELGDYFWHDCHAGAATTAVPVFDYAASIGSTNWSNRGYTGGIRIENMGDAGTDTATIEGNGSVIEGTCTSGALTISGTMTVTGQANITITENARVDAAQLLDAVVDDATKIDASGLNTSSTNSPLIKAQTDKFNFTASDNVQCDVQEVNDIALTGTGESSSPWGPV